jgi:hypothetical protein
MPELKMATDVLTQVVVQAGSLGVLALLVLVVGPRVLKAIIAQHVRDNKSIVIELRKMRRAVHDNTELMTVVIWVLSKNSGDPELQAAVRKRMIKAQEVVKDDEREEMDDA